ncbi:MAG: hypothetical protein ACRCWY_03095 [Cellulosilyticaceae bacterium]
MHDGYKINKHLQRYMGFARTKYHKACLKQPTDLWDVLNSYKDIRSQPYCVQMYIYDLIKGENAYGERYVSVRRVNGWIYVRAIGEEECKIDKR